MKTEINNNSVFIGGIEYIPKNTLSELDEMPYVIIRTYSAGVHLGYLKKKESTLAGMEVTLKNSRRMWEWAGALTLSDLATDGTSKPNLCKLTVEVNSIDLVAIEIISVTEKAFTNLTSIKIWKK